MLTSAACSGGGDVDPTQGASAKAAAEVSARAAVEASASSAASASAAAAEAAALQLAQKSREALKAAGSVAVVLDQPSLKVNPGARFSADTQGNCVGEHSVTVGKMIFRKIGSQIWSHPDEAWLKNRAEVKGTSPEDAEAVAAIMLKFSLVGEAVVKEYETRCSIDALGELIWSDAPATRTLKVTRTGTGTVGQTPVVVLRSAGLTGIATVSVAAEGPPYPVKIDFDSSGSQPSKTITLGAFGEKVQVSKPAPHEMAPDHP